jgi:acetolactate synthase-1/2/3 large subunit
MNGILCVRIMCTISELPVLFVVMNNNMWGAVERSTLAMYPDGHAAKSNETTFIQLGKLPAFEEICKAAAGHGERVDDPGSLPAALERAMSVVKTERRQALLNVICGPGGTVSMRRFRIVSGSIADVSSLYCSRYFL